MLPLRRASMRPSRLAAAALALAAAGCAPHMGEYAAPRSIKDDAAPPPAKVGKVSAPRTAIKVVERPAPRVPVSAAPRPEPPAPRVPRTAEKPVTPPPAARPPISPAPPAPPAASTPPAPPAGTAPPKPVAAEGIPGCGNLDACVRELNELMRKGNREWVRTQPTPQAFASGTRLFALRALRSSLTCKELSQGLSQIAAAAKFLAEPIAGVDAAQQERIRGLNLEVERELRTETRSRC